MNNFIDICQWCAARNNQHGDPILHKPECPKRISLTQELVPREVKSILVEGIGTKTKQKIDKNAKAIFYQ